MEQLSFQFPEDTSMYSVKFYKDHQSVVSLAPAPLAVAQNKRRSFVGVLQRSPNAQFEWEEEPRSTGWFGITREPYNRDKCSTYLITVEPIEG